MHKITDRLRVAVVFGPGVGEIRPAWFAIGRQRHDVAEITYTWQDACEPDGPCRHWTAVTSEKELFELRLVLADLRWECWFLEG